LQERKLGHYAALLDTVRRYRVCLRLSRKSVQAPPLRTAL
jgi:hypothetical protein